MIGRLSLVVGAGLLAPPQADGLAFLNLGMLHYQDPALAPLVPSFFTPLAYMSKLLTRGHEKTRSTLCSGFLVVDYMSKISNLGLVRDIYKILELLVDKNVPGVN